MKKTIVKYFFDFTDKQEKWLNEMSSSGSRLVNCGKLTYHFEQCTPNEYQYCVEFNGEKSYGNHKDYKAFLEGLGYRVLGKNINLNWSIGKMRFRPWAESTGKISTSPGTFNRELLIVEKKNDGKPFELHTDAQDATKFFKTLRNVYFSVTMLGLALASLFIISMFTTLSFVWGVLPEWSGAALFLLISVFGGFYTLKYALITKHYKEIGKTNE